MKEITAEELQTLNGKDGKPIYVAFQGKVYDVSKSPLWSSGLHMNRHSSGKDLTGEISAAPHGTEVFERYPQVGILKKGPPEELKHLPPVLQGFLQRFPAARRHPHPMIVHFPLAFLMGSSLFILLHLLFKKPAFESTSFYLFMPLLGKVVESFPKTNHAYPAEAYHLAFLICFLGMSASVVFYAFSRKEKFSSEFGVQSSESPN